MPITINDCAKCEIPPKLELNFDTKQLEIYCDGRCEKNICFYLTSDLWKENPMDAVNNWNEANPRREDADND